MMPPTSIDGTDITGATIDGTDVQEITVDGQTVFSAESVPVAYGDLHAWFPFDPGFYGGSAEDDVTGIFKSGQSGDGTSQNGTLGGSTPISSGGVTDINAGPSSGHLDLSNNDEFRYSSVAGFDTTVTGWVNPDSLGDNQFYIDLDGAFDFIIGMLPIFGSGSTNQFGVRYYDGEAYSIGTPITTNTWNFFAFTIQSSGVEYYFAGPSDSSPFTVGFDSETPSTASKPDSGFGGQVGSSRNYANGQLDDIRIYRSILSSGQIDDIYANTEP
jgi:hypothetical protein